MTNEKLIEKCLLTDKELRKMAHEYFKAGNRKNSLQAGHWIDFVKHQNRNQLKHAIPILADSIKRELESLLSISMDEMGFVNISNHVDFGDWQNYWRKWGLNTGGMR